MDARRRNPTRMTSALLFALVIAPLGASAQESPPPPADDAPRPPALPALGKDGAGAARLTFDGAVQRALALNPTARQADQEIRRFHALMEEVRASSLPTLNGVGRYTRLDNDRVSNGVVFTAAGTLALNATVSAPLVNPRAWTQWGQASDQIDVARANAADVRRSLALATARAYLAIIAQKRFLETATAARDNAKAHFEYTRAQLHGGVGNRLDEVRAAQQLTANEVLIQNQEVALLRAREALGVLVAANGPVDIADEKFGGPLPSASEALVGAERVRQDVRARERAASAADRRVRDAWADYMPWLTVVAFPFYTNPATSTAPQTGWQADLVLTIPFYDGGLRYGQEHERKALANEAHLAVEAALRQAKSEVRTAFVEIQRADIALDQARQSAAYAEQALKLANLAYRGGLTTNLEVIDAERQARDADTQAAVAEDTARQARLDLLAASGRFP